jgi:hypothetical protein
VLFAEISKYCARRRNCPSVGDVYHTTLMGRLPGQISSRLGSVKPGASSAGVLWAGDWSVRGVGQLRGASPIGQPARRLHVFAPFIGLHGWICVIVVITHSSTAATCEK